MVRAEIRKRESLYGEFIAECSKLLIDALDHTLDNPDKLLLTYALQNRIRLTSSDAVVAAADQTLHSILMQYFEQNITPQQLREELSLSLIDDQRKRNDPLKPFSEVCRQELRALQHAA